MVSVIIFPVRHVGVDRVYAGKHPVYAGKHYMAVLREMAVMIPGCSSTIWDMESRKGYAD